MCGNWLWKAPGTKRRHPAPQGGAPYAEKFLTKPFPEAGVAGPQVNLPTCPVPLGIFSKNALNVVDLLGLAVLPRM